MELKEYISDVPDFPKPGIIFKDIAPLLRNPAAFRFAIDELARCAAPLAPAAIAGIESRGFIFAAPLALRLGLPFVPIRKQGKLPGRVFTDSYDLEYGSATLEIQAEALTGGERVLLVDDVLATGGTALAARRLVGRAGGDFAGALFLIELGFLGGRERLAESACEALLVY